MKVMKEILKSKHFKMKLKSETELTVKSAQLPILYDGEQMSVSQVCYNMKTIIVAFRE